MPKRSRSRQSRRSIQQGGSAHALPQANPHVQVTPGFLPPSVANLASFAGGKRKKRGGTALLDDIAIPALFITANQMYGSRRATVKNRSKRRRIRFSRKVR